MFQLDHTIIYLTLLCIVEIVGDFTLKKYTVTNSTFDLVKGIGWYGGVIFFLIRALTGSTVLYLNNMWDAISAILENGAAYWFLGERFTDPKQYLGILLIILGMYFLGSSKGYSTKKIEDLPL
jgi:multidrug transporter EmrE-like cation transporter